MSTISEPTAAPILAPPRSQMGVVGWMRLNLFSAWYNSAITLVTIVALALALWFGLGWILLEADWRVIGTL
ncbi:MAG: hypothetical protein IIC33_06745, partial [Chloroflexi bacterium]|nr:hypothetical protein [Chloroflexota bacterium]